MANDFEKLYDMEVGEYTETKKNGNTELTYLSWAYAWAIFKKNKPDAKYEIKHWDGRPYYYDENLGYMVETSVTAEDETHSMWLPVMDGANKAMKSHQYTYETKYNGQKTVEAATMFDINTAIMRCLVKNLAMFGLGLRIYAGEDLPDGETTKQGSKVKSSKKTETKVSSLDDIVKGINESMTLENSRAYYAKAISLFGKETPEYKTWVKVWATKKDELEAQSNQKILDDAAEFLDNF